MYCFLCDRPAKYQIVVYRAWNKEFSAKTPKPGPLDVCEDCLRRVRKVEYDNTADEHIVYMRSLT